MAKPLTMLPTVIAIALISCPSVLNGQTDQNPLRNEFRTPTNRGDSGGSVDAQLGSRKSARNQAGRVNKSSVQQSQVLTPRLQAVLKESPARSDSSHPQKAPPNQYGMPATEPNNTTHFDHQVRTASFSADEVTSDYDSQLQKSIQQLSNRAVDSTLTAPARDPLTSPTALASTSRTEPDGRSSFAKLSRKPEAEFINDQVDSEQNSDSKPKKQSIGQSGDEFHNLIKKLATSTMLVLCVGVGLAIAGRRWYLGRTVKKTSQPETDVISIVSTTKLGPKAFLHLAEIGQQKIVVAQDAAGIKSVVALNQSFSNVFDDVAENVDTTEQIAEGHAIRMQDYLEAYLASERTQ